MKILYIAYPLLPVSDASAGGAEQMLLTLEHEMRRRGHDTAVAACSGSQVSGRLIPTGDSPRESDTFEERDREHQRAVRELLRQESFDLIHDKSGSFFAGAGDVACPVLATVHLPRTFYRGMDWSSLPANVTLNCVSAAQARTFADVRNMRGWVQNGMDVERFRLQSTKEGYLLWLGRICEEKAPHLAIEVARRAGRRLVIAGQVYPFRYHQEYFAREIGPHLGGPVQFIESPSFEQKVGLLGHASALLVPSLVEETSSLVALEAMACGTPVIAFRRGALPEIVDHEFTGYIVDDLETMVSAVDRLESIYPSDCRESVEQHFSVTRMAREYETLYRRVLDRSLGEAA